jgi:fucose permease
MFATIFTLGIHGLGVHTKRASGYLMMAIIGGAIIPKVMGCIADRSDLSRAVVVPLVCFHQLLRVQMADLQQGYCVICRTLSRF